jgi:hypothetical protein
MEAKLLLISLLAADGKWYAAERATEIAAKQAELPERAESIVRDLLPSRLKPLAAAAGNVARVVTERRVTLTWKFD